MMRAGVVVAMFIAGCAINRPAPPYIPMSVAGPKPSLEQAEPVVRYHLARTLKDPDSLKQFAMRDVRYAEWRRGGGGDAGWLACFEFNAKNSYGGYGGLVVEGLVIRVESDGVRALDVAPMEVATRC